MTVSSKKRIIFIDMMRAFAVLMMVQGHTIDVFLSDSYRNTDSFIFFLWNMNRGLTAPIFMFSSGVVFTYLLLLNRMPFYYNPRVRKGLRRFVLLVLIGYLLRYPTFTVLDFSFVTKAQWISFFTVDALHLIGFGLLCILCLAFIGEKLKISDYVVFSFGALLFFTLFLFTENISWVNYLPIPFAAYLYHGTGSLFPFFPWAGYVISGAVLGCYLANNPNSFATKNFAFRLFVFGISFIALSQIVELLELYILHVDYIWTDNIHVIFWRMGWVVLLNSFMSYLALNLKSIPDLIKQVGRHTLLVYVVHVIILYGSAWVPGLNLIFSRNMDIYSALIAAIVMIFSMLLMVIGLEKYKLHRKNKLATA
jgi:uncharacterized membrane protein